MATFSKLKKLLQNEKRKKNMIKVEGLGKIRIKRYRLWEESTLMEF